MSKLEFRKPELEDIALMKEAFKYIKHFTCDYTPANIFLWSNIYNTEIAFLDRDLYIKYINNGDTFFGFPFVKKSIKEGIENLKEYCAEKNIEFKMGIIEPEMFEIIDNLYPDEYTITYNRDSSDYVYDIQSMANLAGKKYHGKKNHINKFKKIYSDWTYEKITDENINECYEMLKQWCVENKCVENKSKAEEVCVMLKGLDNMFVLGMIGGIIRTRTCIVAITLGEPVNDEEFVIHFEKAFSDIQGAYPMINQQFILEELMDYKYVNREEDMGVEGLRKAKESYNPVMMAKKGVVVRK